MKPKINLIQPRRFENAGATAEFPPFALHYLYEALAKNTDADLEIFDWELEKDPTKSYADVIPGTPADIFMVTTTTLARFEAVKLIEVIRKTHPESLVVVGGPHFSCSVDDTLNNVPEIDVVVRDEGEITAVELVNAVGQGRSWTETKGISFHEGDAVRHNDPQPVFQDLDELGSIHEVRQGLYRPNLVSYPKENIEAASVMTSRGCPHNCVFCSMAKRKLRYRDPARVADELEHLNQQYGICAFNFLDASFTGNLRHARRICEEIIARKLEVKWWCESRVDIPLDFLDLLKESGCVSIQIGVESGSNRVLKRINKRITRSQVIDFCRQCQKREIYVKPLYMLSLPDETLGDAMRTMQLSKYLEKPPYVLPAPMRVTELYPGTSMAQDARKKGLLPDNFHWYAHYNNRKELNRRLLVENDPFEHIPIFVDAMTIKQLVLVIKLEGLYDGFVGRIRKWIAEPEYRKAVYRDGPGIIYRVVTGKILMLFGRDTKPADKSEGPKS
jgi:radical SAM superfamily enzyme YgiQ (UPF0313 family)